MENCLIKTLKSSANNENLPKYNTFSIPVLNSEVLKNNDFNLGGNGSDNLIVSTTNGATLYNGNGTILTQPFVFNARSVTFKFGTQSVDRYSIEVENAYALTSLRFHALSTYGFDYKNINLDILKYANWSSLHLYNANSAVIEHENFDLDEFVNLDNVNELLVRGFGIFCSDITTLSRIKSSSPSILIDLKGNVGGLEDLAAAWVENNVNNIIATLYFYGTGVATYDNNVLENGNSNKYEISIVNGIATFKHNDVIM